MLDVICFVICDPTPASFHNKSTDTQHIIVSLHINIQSTISLTLHHALTCSMGSVWMRIWESEIGSKQMVGRSWPFLWKQEHSLLIHISVSIQKHTPVYIIQKHTHITYISLACIQKKCTLLTSFLHPSKRNTLYLLQIANSFLCNPKKYLTIQPYSLCHPLTLFNMIYQEKLSLNKI